MTLTRAPIARPRRRVGAIVEGILAACGLLAFLVGIPFVLQVVAPIGWPQTWATSEQIRAVLLRPDDGTLFIGALALVCWAGWAWFTLSVLIEIASAIARTPVPSIPLLGTSRTIAKTLVVAAGVLLTSTAPLVTTATAHATTAIELVLPEQPATFTADAALSHAPRAPHAVAVAQRFAAPAPTPPEVDRHPVITVARGDSLWGLAERHLGAGSRFTEIRDLNLHRPQADGRALTGEHWLYPGWQLRLPLDAGALPANVTAAINGTNTAATDQAQPAVHDVVSGETLWNIAETRLGNGARYPEIYDLNAGAPQSDGGTLTDPDLIRPGWRLTLPASAPATATSSVDTIPAGAAAAGGSGTCAATSPPAPETEPAEVGSSSADVEPRALAPAGLNPADSAPTQEADDAAPDNSEPDGSATDSSLARVLVLGLTTLTAAGIIGELARRRARQRRLRRAGERIARPEPTSPEAVTERTLRQAEVPFTPVTLREGLHLLGPACRAAARDLPRVAAVLVGGATIDLLLIGDDDRTVGPFESVGPRTWRTSHDAFISQDCPDDLGIYPLPYPALVSVGVMTGQVVLLNLEAAGTFAVNGPDHIVTAVMRGLACELATSDLSAGIELVLGPEHADLVEVCPSVMVHSETTTGDLQIRLSASARDNTQVLLHAKAADALHARATLSGDDTWTPTVFVSSDVEDNVAPWAGQALVTSTRPAEWRLDVDDAGAGRLEPLGLTVDAQRLSTETYGEIIAALRIGAIEPVRDEFATPPTLHAEAEAIRTSLAEEEVSTAAMVDASPSVSSGEASDDAFAPTVQTEVDPPRVLVLGPVRIVAVADQSPRNRTRRHTELITFLALNPDATSAQVDEVIGHGRRVDSARRNQDVSRARGWLGTRPDGSPYLTKLTGQDRYRLDPAVRTDWEEFLDLTRRALDPDQFDAPALRMALGLVRGRPFQGVSGSAYDWAEPLIGTMIEQIADAAHVLARLELDAGDLRAARHATTTGLVADPCNEMLFRDAIEAAHRAGDRAEVSRLTGMLRARIDAIDPGCDLEDATLELLETVDG